MIKFFSYGDVGHLPVASDSINIIRSRGLSVSVHDIKKRQIFYLLDIIRDNFIKKSSHRYVFINIQSILVIIILGVFIRDKRLIYWKFESKNYKHFPKNKIDFLFFAERFISSRTLVIYPNEERRIISKIRSLVSYVVYNKPGIRIAKNNNSVSINGSIKLLIYGNFNRSSKMYLEEWISFIRGRIGFELHIVGCDSSDRSDNIFFHERKSNADLRKFMIDSGFHYSIVAYKPTGEAFKFCAPNKLLESVFCGIPVIVDANNPWCSKLVMRHMLGIVADFSSLNYLLLDSMIASYSDCSKYCIEYSLLNPLDKDLKCIGLI